MPARPQATVTGQLPDGAFKPTFHRHVTRDPVFGARPFACDTVLPYTTRIVQRDRGFTETLTDATPFTGTRAVNDTFRTAAVDAATGIPASKHIVKLAISAFRTTLPSVIGTGLHRLAPRANHTMTGLALGDAPPAGPLRAHSGRPPHRSHKRRRTSRLASTAGPTCTVSWTHAVLRDGVQGGARQSGEPLTGGCRAHFPSVCRRSSAIETVAELPRAKRIGHPPPGYPIRASNCGWRSAVGRVSTSNTAPPNLDHLPR